MGLRKSHRCSDGIMKACSRQYCDRCQFQKWLGRFIGAAIGIGIWVAYG